MQRIHKEFMLAVCVVIAFAAIYALAWTHFDFEAWIDPLYFSSTVSSTVGFGDNLPVTTTGKAIVMVHQMIVIVGVIAVAERLVMGGKK